MEQLKRILFFDIETVPLYPDYDDLSEVLQQEWGRKTKFLKRNMEEESTDAALFSEKAGVYSEFAKVVCIGFGSLYFSEGKWTLRLKALTNDDEKELLKEFAEMVNRFEGHYNALSFCGHNIKEFDIPFLCRRMIINGVKLPKPMNIAGMKPWENPHLDTLDMWKFGDYKHYTSLALLAEILGIPSPKDDIDGSMVADVYWKEQNLPRIAKYCLQDVLTSARVYLRLKDGVDIQPEPVFVDE